MYGPAYVDMHYAVDGEAQTAEPNELHSVAMRAAELRPGGSLLDIGCGAGGFLKKAAQHGLKVEGFEINEDSARRTASVTGFQVHSRSLRELDKTFDIVHLADVLEHLPNPLESLVEARRLAGRTGVIIARGPLEAQANLFDLLMRARRWARGFLGPTTASIPPWHLVLFSLSGWRALSTRARLRTLDEVVVEGQWPAPQTGLRSSIKVASRWISASAVGQRMDLGNRATSIWQADG
jgi:SAM-dependent methyltransferase